VAKVRVYELAKEFGVESKAVMVKLNEMGEFVRSASSTIEAPVVRRLKEAFASKATDQSAQGSRSRPAVPSAPRDAGPVTASPGQAAPRDPAVPRDGARPGAGPRPGAPSRDDRAVPAAPPASIAPEG